MANILFLGLPSFGHINPTIGLVAELCAQGHAVTYFASEKFRAPLEAAGADVRCYAADLDFFVAPKPGSSAPPDKSPLMRVLAAGPTIVADILEQTEGRRFDRLLHSAAFPFAQAMAQILKVPTVSSLGIFFGLDAFLSGTRGPVAFGGPALGEIFLHTAQTLRATYGVSMPDDPLSGLFNKGDLNLVYTSRYFAGSIPYFDDSFMYVGPPVYEREEQVDFPLHELVGRRVLYISLGTVFGAHAPQLYALFFEAFRDWDGIVVLAAHKVDPAAFDIPGNFIVRDYVPQHEILRRATAAITHCGMNSMNDILSHEVPFIALPLGADQPLLAARAEALGAAIRLDHATLTAAQLRAAVDRVIEDPDIHSNIARINDSFKQAGGYPAAVKAILELPETRR